MLLLSPHRRPPTADATGQYLFPVSRGRWGRQPRRPCLGHSPARSEAATRPTFPSLPAAASWWGLLPDSHCQRVTGLCPGRFLCLHSLLGDLIQRHGAVCRRLPHFTSSSDPGAEPRSGVPARPPGCPPPSGPVPPSPPPASPRPCPPQLRPRAPSRGPGPESEAEPSLPLTPSVSLSSSPAREAHCHRCVPRPSQAAVTFHVVSAEPLSTGPKPREGGNAEPGPG